MSHVPEHFDVIIVGAGISGVGAAYHLKTQCPGKTFMALEAKPTFGGTWVTHRYPGIRSDSELYTFGYRFKPWTSAPIATAAEILKYMGEVVEENALAPHIRYQHRIESAAWSSTDQRWQLQVRRGDTGELLAFSCGFLWMCQGYYKHAEGYTPDWPGLGDFQGRIVHPQTWPEDLNLKGQRVVVIGSGATAATLVPAIADEIAGSGGTLTLLQRSPTYFITGRNINELADTLRQLEVPETWTHEIVRRKALFDQAAFAARTVSEPEAVKRDLLAIVKAYVGDKVDIAKHFTPRYRPWQQRVAFIPDGDLFKAFAQGKASVVTDEIECFTPGGIRLKSGEALAADIVITATGFHLSALGDITFSIDGQPLDFGSTITYRGAMFTGVPNLLWVFGYLRSSWTLRVDLLGDFTCRLLKHMDALGANVVTPQLREADQGMQLLPWVDPDNFNPGYMNRGMHLLPRQGTTAPWQHDQNYMRERQDLPAANLDDGALRFE